MRSDRPPARSTSRPSRPPRRVLLLVDHGGLADSPSGADAPEAAPLAERLHAYAASLGRVVSATAYADWTALGDDALAYRRCGVEPRLVLPGETGDDRADLVLALDALEAALTVPGVGIVVLASGDAGLRELVVRLRRTGREVVVCGPRGETAEELIRAADRYVPFETLLASPPRTPAAGAAPAEPVAVDFASYDWSRFLRLLDELEKRLSFVGLKYLNHKVLNRENCGFEDRARRQALINHAIDSGILVTYRVDNIEAGGDPVTACRLDRAHEVVRSHLGEPKAAGEVGETPPAEGDG